MTITPDELRSRLQLDYRVAHDMFGSVFSGEAYRTAADLEARRNPIKSADQGHLATKYRVDFHVRTLIGPGQFSDVTTIAFDLDQPGYPDAEPGTQVLSKQIPYSPILCSMRLYVLVRPGSMPKALCCLVNSSFTLLSC